MLELLRFLAIFAPAFVGAEIMLGIYVLKKDPPFHDQFFTSGELRTGTTSLLWEVATSNGGPNPPLEY
jgi:hypothetical protein